jgi:hypothetical protein
MLKESRSNRTASTIFQSPDHRIAAILYVDEADLEVSHPEQNPIICLDSNQVDFI